MPHRRPAVPAVALLAALAAVPALPAAARADAPPAAAAARSAEVRIAEGQVREAAPGGSILYPSVTSCLTITVRLRGGGLAGAHASLFQVPGEYRSDAVLPALRRLTGARRATAVEVRGAVGAWHPGYLTKAVEAYGEGEDVPTPAHPDPDGIAEAVARGLGLPRALVTVEDVPDGDIRVR
ncbi:hypothetical protein [Streptomyces caatingaensis]|uniref:Uncharacterized protein n=1 Tax=Streptomyces caatingaensis TaxID=1678637 RepID=A0A0K9XBA2_9ACTN|nr:hypothetical protein [Streptomyces caatingaensis]KNB50675.1 hypothetical protein AC230_22035 [Streptomyces caatingaensis]